ncbi:Fcf2-domain-containing protein [Saitoella complicata NRRL Y-17804]|nr:Fcf2-domain-containing protein [Saitoella complicata NRRL Y-17804]ODQ55676.1 Fcf2-domain-containing protein [Saitoella complicata NRRL Y-17804]
MQLRGGQRYDSPGPADPSLEGQFLELVNNHTAHIEGTSKVIELRSPARRARSQSPVKAMVSPSKSSHTLLADDDEEFSEEMMERLLGAATDNLQKKQQGGMEGDDEMSLEAPKLKDEDRSWLKFPKLNPGALPQPYVSTQGAKAKVAAEVIQRAAPKEEIVEDPVHGVSIHSRSITDNHVTKQEKQKQKDATVGKDWFDMPATELTPGIKRDLQLIKMRNVLDAKRHYRKDNSKTFPKYFQVGTIVEGPTEYYSARIPKSGRKETILGELLAETDRKEYFKRKYGDIQEKANNKTRWNKKTKMRS